MLLILATMTRDKIYFGKIIYGASRYRLFFRKPAHAQSTVFAHAPPMGPELCAAHKLPIVCA